MNKLISVFLCLFFITTCTADVFHVDANGTGDYPTIQAAINDANNGDIIEVADGIYTGLGNRDIDFKGLSITVKSKNGPDNCIIDCQGTESEPHRGFYFHSSEDPNSVLDGFTIKNGWEDIGGAIKCEASFFQTCKPFIVNCIMKNNIATDGGAIGCDFWSGPIVKNCEIINNKALGGGGGGIYYGHDYNYEDVVSNCLIKNNYAQNGGGVANCTSLSNCVIINNYSEGVGGGVLFCERVKNCYISDNYSTYNGGGLAICGDVINSIVSGNKAGRNGGGLSGITGEINNSTICFNRADNGNGGGIYISGDEVTITNSILWDNTASYANEVYLRTSYYTIAMPPYVREETSTMTVRYSDITDGQEHIHVDPNSTLIWETGNFSIDPCFVDNGYWDVNGTPSDVNDDFWIDGDYHFQSGARRWEPDINSWVIGSNASLCIDAGDNNAVTEVTDLDGRDRIVDGDCNNTDIVDMGAYEFTSAYYGDFDGDCDVEFIDYSILANFYMTDEFSVDIAPTPAGDGIVDASELAILCENWLCGGDGCGYSGWTELTYDDFESGWGNWVSGGLDCMLYEGGEHAHQPNNAVNIQDDSKIESAFQLTSGIDVNTPGYTQIEVDFWFKAVSMEIGEDFFLQYRDGSEWHRIKTYVRGTDDIVNGEFINNKFYHDTVYINEAVYIFPINMKIRFRCDASGNVDDVYIDEITISAR
ncbi:MAG: hypothetical protein ACYSUK_03545 [Planctomycetota bacterium]|jgi:hypothetical protein